MSTDLSKQQVLEAYPKTTHHIDFTEILARDPNANTKILLLLKKQKTLWRRRNNVSLYVPETLQVRLK